MNVTAWPRLSRRYFLALMISALPLVAATPAADSAPAHNLLVYFGTYTGAKSQGIYSCRLDLATGKLSAAELAGEVANPSFLAIHPNHRYLYAVNEVASFGGKKTGAVAAFALDPGTGKLTLLNQQPSGGDGPCHLNVDASGKAVLVANYGGGSCAVLPILGDGRLDAPSAVIQHAGSSVNKQRQQRPHAHGIYLDSGNRFALVPDLGMDQVLIYKFDPGRGSLVPNDPPFASLAPGSGPRHFAFHPAGKYGYAINEMLCTITAFQFDAERGQLRELQTVSTLPNGQSVQSGDSTAEIEVHPSGRFLYGSNRGHDTIVVYVIDESTGRLRLVQHEPTQGKIPRGFGIDPTGRYLLAANQNSDTVVSFKIDGETGRLSATGQTIQVPTPVCVKFLPTPK